MPTKSRPGESRTPIAIPPHGNEKHSLPDSYASVPAVALKTTAVMVPECDVFPVESCLEEAIAKEQSWAEHALPLLGTELGSTDAIAWAAYHASMQPQVEDPALCALLPLFYEKSATPAMIKHGMDVERQAIQFLNPGQIPITTFDQPLFALAKFVQWKWPDTRGEKVHVIMLGGLHTEMALWNTLGDELEGSGWTAALTQADVASSGTADSYLKATHLTRTRHAHQVTLLDHVNYSRWMHVHIRDMKSLPDPIKDEFENHSHWVLSKTMNTFSAIPFDQAHEQENNIVKGSGGAVGLTENPVAFRRWMLSGPEMARLLKQFEEELNAFLVMT